MNERDPSEVRREAFRAAAGSVDRFLQRAGGPVSDDFGEVGAVAWDRFRSELARVVDLNLEMVRDAFGLYGTLLAPESLQRDRTGGELTLGPGAPGSEAAAVLWLHNFEEDPMQGVRLVGSGLSSEGGEDIEEPGWSFTPSTVSVPPRSAVPVLVRVAVPPGAVGGTYGGTITASGGEGQAIDVRVEVVSMGPVPHDSW